MPEFPIVSANALASLQKRAGMPGESDELQGGIESLAVAVTRGLVTLPLMLQLPAPPAPDALIISAGTPLLGIEVTRVGWQRLTHVRSEAVKGGISFLEIGENLLVDEPGRRDKSAPKGSRSGDFEAIRKPGEPMRGAGLLGAEAYARTKDALRAAVSRKQPKLQGYRSSVNQVWLFLIADGLIANWEDILTRDDLKNTRQDIQTICSSSGFDEVLLWRNRQDTVSLL